LRIYGQFGDWLLVIAAITVALEGSVCDKNREAATLGYSKISSSRDKRPCEKVYCYSPFFEGDGGVTTLTKKKHQHIKVRDGYYEAREVMEK
jgi:hypothetical protein